jgi:thioredoxin 1
MANPVKLDGNNWQNEVLDSDRPVLVDFWAPWCGPCKMVGPIVEELANDYDGRIKVGKVNVDDNQQLASQFGIRGIPTLMIFNGGQVANSFVGLRSKEDLSAALEAVL